MKRIFVTTVLGVLLLAAVAFLVNKPPAMKMVATVRADEGTSCSLASVAGKYAFSFTGTLFLPAGPVPIAAVGRATSDANGNTSGTEARSVGGSFADETFTGTFTVNPDCTGAATLRFFESGVPVRTTVLALVIDDNLKEIRFVQKSLTLPDGTNLPVVVSGSEKKMFAAEESN